MYSSHSTRDGLGLDDLFRPGDHVCHFFRSGDELGEVLIPYFKAGLERNERCIWVTGHPYGRDRAGSEMRVAMADFDRRVAAGQILILNQDEWYPQQGMMSPAMQAHALLTQQEEAIAAGYAGLRASGNTSFLDDRAAWGDFLNYERATNEIFKGKRCTGLCSYGFDLCSPREIVDVVHRHGFGLARRHGRWGLIEVRSHGGVEAAGHSHHVPSSGRGDELQRIVEDQLAIFIGACPERIALQGGRVDLSGPQATKLAILLSELTTNAAKYGALTSPQGKLAVKWRVVANGSRRLHVEWTESGSVNLEMPERIGSGTQLMAGTAVNCVRFFSPTGMACEFELSLDDSDAAPLLAGAPRGCR